MAESVAVKVMLSLPDGATASVQIDGRDLSGDPAGEFRGTFARRMALYELNWAAFAGPNGGNGSFQIAEPQDIKTSPQSFNIAIGGRQVGSDTIFLAPLFVDSPSPNAKNITITVGLAAGLVFTGYLDRALLKFSNSECTIKLVPKQASYGLVWFVIGAANTKYTMTIRGASNIDEKPVEHSTSALQDDMESLDIMVV